MKKLAKLVKELEYDLLKCVRCGTCLAVCPLYNITKQESDVARGKLSLLDGLIKNLFSNPDEVNKKLNKCLLCGSCAAKCPSNVNVVEIFIKARIILTEYSKLSLSKKIIFRSFLAKPERFDKVISFSEKFQFLIFKKNKKNYQMSLFRFIPSFSFIKRRGFKTIAKTPFHKTGYAKSFHIETSKLKVAFFPGCGIDKIFPGIAIDTVKILKHYNVDIYIPKNQGCCGIPALASGDKITFDKLVGHNIDIFSCEKFDYLITPCATCLSTIKNLWPSMYDNQNKEKNDFLLNLSAKALDISQFLINILKVPDIIVNKKTAIVTYHDPCHHKKVLNIKTEPRELIKVSGHKLVEMENSDTCCGMGGTFNLSYYGESSKIGKIKGENIIKTNCSVVSTSCPACMMQLFDILNNQNVTIDIKHPIELFSHALLNNEE